MPRRFRAGEELASPLLRALAPVWDARGAMPGASAIRLSPRAHWGIFALFFASAAAPVLSCGILPLVDYPNHLTRMSVLARLPHDALLARYYAAAWAPIPDLAMDALVPPLLRFLPLEAAGHVFVLTTFLLLAGGAAVLGRVLSGRWSPWPLMVFLLLYNRLLLWGLLNYLFGLGLALWALALMLALARRGAGLRLAVGAVAAFVLYFAHLMAFGVYAAALAGLAAAPPWRSARELASRVAIAGAPLLPPMALLLWGAGEGGGVIAFSAPGRKLDLMFSVFDLYHRPFDIACFGIWAGGLAYGYARRWLALARPLALPLGLLTLLYLLLPTQMMGASGIDRRLPLALALILAAGTHWAAPRPRLERWALAAAAVLYGARLATVALSWHASDAEYRADLAALRALPEGARLAVAAPPDAANVTATPLFHFPTLAAAERDAFVPTIFTIRGQQPLVFTPPYAALAERTSPDGLWRRFVEGRDGTDIPAGYDYVVFTGLTPFTLADAPGLVPLYRAPRFQLYRVGG